MVKELFSNVNETPNHGGEFNISTCTPIANILLLA
jgi:hypothetical protein